MIGNNMTSFVLVSAVASLLFVGGCGSAQKTVPHMGFGTFDIKTELTREDVVVLDRVEGSSTTLSIVFGVIQIIDGDKLKLFWIPFFQEKCTYFQGLPGLWAVTADRAYYKALEAAPESDFVFFKSMDHEYEGIPGIFHMKRVTFKGRAVKLKADQ
jgi:hypothetical protein